MIFQLGPALPDLAPPQPTTGFGETIVASNPFDDTVPAATTVPHAPPMPMPGMAPHMPGPPIHNKPVPISSGKVVCFFKFTFIFEILYFIVFLY